MPEFSTESLVELEAQRVACQQIAEHIELGEHTIVIGPPGCGKSTIAKDAARRLGRPCAVFHLGGVTDAEQMVFGGMRLVAGETRFVRSRFVETITREGVVIVLDELNRCPGLVHNALLSVLDPGGRLVIDHESPDRRVVPVARGVVFVATVNHGAEFVGTDPMDRALEDRFAKVTLGYPGDEDKLLAAVAGVTQAQARDVVKAARAIREQHAHGSLPCTLSMRRAIFAGKLLALGHDLDDAILRNLALYDEESRSAALAVLKALRGAS